VKGGPVTNFHADEDVRIYFLKGGLGVFHVCLGFGGGCGGALSREPFEIPSDHFQGQGRLKWQGDGKKKETADEMIQEMNRLMVGWQQAERTPSAEQSL
jgi:hypothetical protein